MVYSTKKRDRKLIKSFAEFFSSCLSRGMLDHLLLEKYLVKYLTTTKEKLLVLWILYMIASLFNI
ncbi:unnamed protein product [Meloidogyne enterolobii]|uniref:Uncharacterized protein n=1 Tax=Meloidogyne enterolobii TaxID=390850 RepID=A0ACB1A8Q2_MELEN